MASHGFKVVRTDFATIHSTTAFEKYANGQWGCLGDVLATTEGKQDRGGATLSVST